MFLLRLGNFKFSPMPLGSPKLMWTFWDIYESWKTGYPGPPGPFLDFWEFFKNLLHFSLDLGIRDFLLYDNGHFKFHDILSRYLLELEKWNTQVARTNSQFLRIFQKSSMFLLRLGKFKFLSRALGPLNSISSFQDTHRTSKNANVTSIRPFLNFLEFFIY